MALAVRFDQLIRDGVVKDLAEIARPGFVTRARVTQIMNLLNLAPAVQDALLYGAPRSRGKDQITERQVRHVMDFNNWAAQRRAWQHLSRFVC